MSADYKNREDIETGVFNYGPEDIFLGDDGVYHSRWQTRKLPTSDVPSLMFIDEWSRYTQAEIDLINRFAAENGIQVIASGDMDQLSPKAIYKSGVKGEPDVELSIARNITPRAPKLGISMRAGNGQKVQNLYALLQWKLHPSKDAIPLYYVETDSDLYGDKVVSTAGELTDKQLQDIKKDLDKMVANLDAESHEKIGYIYHKKGTKLYDLLNSDQYKDKIDFKSEAAAQGREARYYIVENNRSIEQDEMAYHKSLYTGISRAEQASIVIAPNQSIGKLQVKKPAHQENKLIPDNFTTEGIARFSKQRKALLDKIYGDTQDPDLSTIVPRTKEEINVTPSNVKPEPKPEQGKKGKKDNPKKEDSKTNIDLSKAQFQKGNVITNGDATLTILDVEPGDNESINYKIDFGNGPVSIAEQKLLEQGYQVQPPQPKEETTPPATIDSTTDTTEGSDVEGSTAITGLPAVQGANNAIGSIGTDTTETHDTTWEFSEENLQNVLNTIVQVGVVDGTTAVSFQLRSLENALNVNPGDLNTILSVLTQLPGKPLQETSPGTYRLEMSQEKLQKAIEETQGEAPQTETPVANYVVGDEFLLKKNEPPYKVTGVFFDQESNSYKYKLTRDALEIIKNESELDALKTADQFTDQKDVIKGDGHTQEPEGPHNFYSQQETEKGLEELQSSEDSEVPELTVDASGDVQVRITGHTFNTNYLGCQFDDKGNAVLPQEGEPGAKRIDQANGIVKLTKGRISTKSKLQETIGAIRQAMMFKDLTELEESLKGILPELKDQKLKLQWAFISKAAIPNKENRDRFSYDPEQRLDYMTDDEHADIPIKMISLLVQDESGACVLEMPLLTLGSPFTALYQLGQIDKENKIYQAYETSVASGKNLHLVLQDVINAIENEVTAKSATGGIKPGYKRLQDLCKLWQFTSDGIRFIKQVGNKPFNIKDCTTNLGVHFVKSRTTELAYNSPKVSRYEYSGKWNNLNEVASHKDVNYSSIMEFATEYDDSFNRLGPKGHPFVLRSDSSEFKDDASMMERYLEQLKHPELPKIVKLELISPPEIGIYDYLEARSQTLACHYGNQFSAYRILDAIRKMARNELWLELSPEIRDKAGQIIDALNAKQEELQQETEENHQQYMSRVYKAQREILDEMNGVKILSDALFRLTFDYKNGSEGIAVFNKDNALKIATVCESQGMTGIQYRPIFQQGDPVAGYGYRVKTGADKYCSEDGKSYRIYSKFDPPIFELESIADQISNWANSYTVKGNIYRFNNVSKNGKETKDYAYAFYMNEGEQTKAPEKSPNQKLREKYSDLLEKLGLKDYDALDNIEDESHFLEVIRDKYVETPGNVAVVVDGKKLLYGQLDGIEVEGDTTSPINLEGAAQISFKSNNTQDNTYTLTIKPANSNENVEIPVEAIAGENKFRLNLGTPETKVDLQPISDTFDYNPYIEALTTKAATLPVTARNFYNLAIKAITEGVNANKSKAEITQDIIKVFKGNEALAKSFFKRALSEEQAKKLLEQTNTDEQSTETEEKPSMCPIFGSLIYN